MNIEMALSVGGFLIGVIGVIYALIANRDKARMEKFIHIRLKGIAGSAHNMSTEAHWACDNLSAARAEYVKSDKEPNEGSENRSAETMAFGLLNSFLDLQQGMFNTREMTGYFDTDKNGNKMKGNLYKFRFRSRGDEALESARDRQEN